LIQEMLILIEIKRVNDKELRKEQDKKCDINGNGIKKNSSMK